VISRTPNRPSLQLPLGEGFMPPKSNWRADFTSID
jgi:hypothetical protein